MLLQSKPSYRTAKLLALLSSLALVCGCSDSPLPTYAAGGTVAASDGRSLSGGWVEFKPVDGEHLYGARGQIQPDGSFQLSTFAADDGATVGRHRALVIPPQPTGDRDENPVPQSVIDPKYLQFETSGLEFTVSENAAENQYAIVVDRPR